MGDEAMDSINTRIAILEVIVIDLKKGRDHHENLLEAMSESNHKMAMSLSKISTQLATGIKSIGAGFLLVTTLVSAGWVYQQNIEAKIAQRAEVMSVGLADTGRTLEQHEQRLLANSADNMKNEISITNDANTSAERAAGNRARLDVLESKRVIRSSR